MREEEEMGSARKIKSYLTFVPSDKPGRKTHNWFIKNHDGEFLGEIYWRTGWRKYVAAITVKSDWSIECLRELQTFIHRQMDLHKERIHAQESVCDAQRTKP